MERVRNGLLCRKRQLLLIIYVSWLVSNLLSKQVLWFKPRHVIYNKKFSASLWRAISGHGLQHNHMTLKIAFHIETELFKIVSYVDNVFRCEHEEK